MPLIVPAAAATAATSAPQVRAAEGASFPGRQARPRPDPRLDERQRRLRVSVAAYISGADLGTFLTVPIIYSLLVPLAVLDAWVTVYQWVCFPLYGMARVPRRRYFAIDRHMLTYLNAIEKVNCTFCSYANGVLAYAREVAARTEQYWCPIKHAHRIPAPHSRYGDFADFGDAEAFRAAQPRLPRQVQDVRPRTSGGNGRAVNRTPW